MSHIKENVKKSYGAAITQRMTVQNEFTSCCSSESSTEDTCCPPTTLKIQDSEESVVPSFGCVVSLATKANLERGDVVVDLGSGAGHDVFEAAEYVGPEGRVVGIDFTPEMLTTAMKTASERKLTNVEFINSDIEKIMLPDNFADVVISNCVINLAVDKGAVFKEVFRILRPGGRLVDADIVAVNPLPTKLVENQDAWCGCLGGALTENGYKEKIAAAGFSEIKVTNYGDFTSDGIKFQNGLIEAWKPL